jgi:hypothetical protein
MGWSKTGTAFDFQPTFGDNLKHRAIYSQAQARSMMSQYSSMGSDGRGQYYVSTYDKHPDKTQFPPGNIQGVQPIGTLSSDVFMILGSKISFLVGGGCDPYHIYVELLIDGYSIGKVTGKCSEVMKPASFDVSKYKHRAGQLRIVDNSAAPWGFIIVDEFHFDWEVSGAIHSNAKTGQTSHGGMTEAVMSGAAYVYHRTAANGFPCTKDNELDCSWSFDSKLLPSDKRQGAKFGSQVTILDDNGIIAVSAPYAPLFMSYKDTPTAYPYIRSNRGESSGAGLQFPIEPHNMTLFQSSPGFLPQASGSSGVWNVMERQKLFPEVVTTGAVYVYTLQHQILGHTGQKAIESYWPNTEAARIQAGDLETGDRFGSCLSSSKSLTSLFIGAPGFNSNSKNRGAVYVYKLEFAAVRFEQV